MRRLLGTLTRTLLGRRCPLCWTRTRDLPGHYESHSPMELRQYMEAMKR